MYSVWGSVLGMYIQCTGQCIGFVQCMGQCIGFVQCMGQCIGYVQCIKLYRTSSFKS